MILTKLILPALLAISLIAAPQATTKAPKTTDAKATTAAAKTKATKTAATKAPAATRPPICRFEKLLLFGDDLILDFGVDGSRKDLLVEELVLRPVRTTLDDLCAVSDADAR